MNDEQPNIVLEHLKHIRAKVDAAGLDMIDVKTRLSAQEEILGQILVLLAAQNRRSDRSDERVSRIERRLDLVEG